MPTLKPFRAMRYNPEIAGDYSELVAPPYDIIYDEWRERLYDRNPYNIIRLIKAKDEPGDGENPNKYKRASDYIKLWIEKGVLRYEDKPSIYVRSDTYTLGNETKTRYGFIALLRIEQFGNNVHPHERTLSGPKVDRLNLVKATRTNLSQIFSIFKDPGDTVYRLLLNKTTELPPEIEFEDEQGIIRRMWVVNDEDFIAGIKGRLRDRDIIIADGHHRYETALAYKELMEKNRTSDDEPFDYVSMYFSSADAPGMTILPTHRKVLGLESFDEDTFFRKLDDRYKIEPVGKISVDDLLNRIHIDSEKNNIFGFCTASGLRIARIKNPEVPKQLDVDILHNDIIENRLGITREDIAAGRYLHFSKSPEHCIDDVSAGKDQMGIFLNAIRSEELFRRVLDGDRMPQKSTYFYPKTLSGLAMYKIDRRSF